MDSLSGREVRVEFTVAYEDPVMFEALAVFKAVRLGRRPRIKHAENPDRPGRALCGAKLRARSVSAEGAKCVVCLDLTRRTFLAR